MSKNKQLYAFCVMEGERKERVNYYVVRARSWKKARKKANKRVRRAYLMPATVVAMFVRELQFLDDDVAQVGGWEDADELFDLEGQEGLFEDEAEENTAPWT